VPRPLRVRNGLGGTGSPCLASCPDDRRPTVVGHARLAQAPPCGRYLPRYAVVDCACVVAAHKARLLPSGIQFAAISTPPLKRPRFTKISASFSLSPKCSSRSSLKRRRLRSSTADPGFRCPPLPVSSRKRVLLATKCRRRSAERLASKSSCCRARGAEGACLPACQGRPDAVALGNVAQPPADDAANSEAAPLAHRR